MWRTRCPCPCFVSLLSGLSCTAYICIWLPFLPYAYYMWLPWFISLLFLGFSLLNPFLAMMSFAGYFHARFLLSAFFAVCLSYFVLFCFPTVFVPDLFWCNFLYLVTTAGFVADQLIMRDKQQRVRLWILFWVVNPSRCFLCLYTSFFYFI